MQQIRTTVEHYASMLEPHVPGINWNTVQFFLDETPNNVFGFCNARVLKKGKKFSSYVSGAVPTITINRAILEKFPSIANEVIIPHEMGHVAQWAKNREMGHDQFFDWTMRKMGVQEGAFFDAEGYQLSANDREKLNLLTGKQKKVVIQHEDGERFTITANMWTRMITTPRRSKSGKIITRQNCRVVMTSDSI